MDLFTAKNDDLKKIFGLRKILGKLLLSQVIEASCGYKILPIDSKNPQDKALIRHLTYALDSFVALTKKTGQRFRGNRINDIGSKIEGLIEAEISKTPLEISKLGKTGYPDFEIRQNDRVTYLELKTTGNINKKSTHHRMFYFTTGKKIKNDGRHLLLQIQMEEESNKYWQVVAWHLRDLAGLKVSLKAEFNANFQDIELAPLILDDSSSS
jgi:hypothetical protein